GVLREFRLGDEQSLARHANDRGIWRNLKDAFPHPYTVHHAGDWVKRNLDVSPPRHLAIAIDGQVVGGVGCDLKDDIWRYSAELGYWLGREYQGRGIMSHAVAAMVDYAFATFDINRLWAGAFYRNAASRRILEKCGFTLEGRLEQSAFKDGVFVDELIYAIVRPRTRA
ncbi:MAG: GNAT family N-acetyltransferase, partial [Gemmatimonadaceae bacterium]